MRGYVRRIFRVLMNRVSILYIVLYHIYSVVYFVPVAMHDFQTTISSRTVGANITKLMNMELTKTRLNTIILIAVNSGDNEI